MKKLKRKLGECEDCGTNTYLGDNYYMVTCKIWNEYGLGGSEDTDGGWRNINDKESGMLCIKCLETRMGRKLTRSDLMDCPANEDNSYTAQLLV